MNFSTTRENEEILKKLDRMLGICLNTRDNVDYMLNKYNNMSNITNDNELMEDIGIVSNNLSTIMSGSDPILKHYIVVPNTVENENSK
jgi:hypothetical protein